MSHPSVSPLHTVVFHHFRCDPALSVFASKCQGVMSCLNGCSLWSRGSWLGGSLVSALSCVASYTLWFGPGVFWRVLVRCFMFGAIVVMTHKMSSCMNPYWLQSLFLVCFWLFCLFFVVCFCGFLCFFCFAGIAYWTAYRSITSTFVAIDYWQPCTIITIQLLLRSNVCNDLAKAMKALDGKKMQETIWDIDLWV